MNKSVRSYLLTCAICICFFSSAFGQKAWEKKPYAAWSMSEVMQILTDSPWAQTQIEDVHITYQLPANSYSATLRLRSALPIRQALLRQKQILMNYDKFNAADKAKFDRETKQFLDCPDCANYYIVTLGSPIFSYESRSRSDPTMVFDIVGTLKNLSLAELKSNVYLSNDKGERRDIIQFIAPKGEGKEAMFVFPRLDNQGNALITRGNKNFYFKIEAKLFDKRSVPLKKFTFNVQPLIQHGEIVF